MEESLTLWESVANSRWFLSTTIVLLLNKQDLFREKLGRHPLSDYFNDYDGATFADAQAYMTAKFLGVVQRHKVYPHVTTATSTEQMKSVLGTLATTLSVCLAVAPPSIQVCHGRNPRHPPSAHTPAGQLHLIHSPSVATLSRHALIIGRLDDLLLRLSATV